MRSASKSDPAAKLSAALQRSSVPRLAANSLRELQEIIDASPCGNLTFLVTEFGWLSIGVEH